MPSRRTFLASLTLGVIVFGAPAIVPITSLMRVRSFDLREPDRQLGFAMRLYLYSRTRAIADLQSMGSKPGQIARELNLRGLLAMNSEQWTARRVRDFADKTRVRRINLNLNPTERAK